MTKRNIEIKVRLSRKEAENLNKQVKKCRLSREAYLRHLITGEVPREAPPPEYFAFMREMHYVGHNLNQIAQKAHDRQNGADAGAKPHGSAKGNRKGAMSHGKTGYACIDP